MNNYSLLSIVPPLLVLVTGYLTKKIIPALLLGIVAAALIATNFEIVSSIKLMFFYLWKNLEFGTFFSTQTFWNTWNLFICIFLLVLGIFVALLQHSGGVFAYGNFVKRYIHNKKGAEKSSLILSKFLFIDDYFSSLTVGSVMRPITDAKQIPRAKLAFLVDSMAAPLAVLCPFSSWVAALLGFLRENGISETQTSNTIVLASPLTTYFHILPYIFYSFILVVGIWYIVNNNISFGLMKKHEDIALKTKNLFGGDKPLANVHNNLDHSEDNTSLIDFLVPVIILLLSIFCGMLFSGHWKFFGGEREFLAALQHSSAAMALFIGGVAVLIICTVFFIMRRKIKSRAIPKIYGEGFMLMASAIVILMLAWTLGDILRNDLHTGRYIANVMIGSVSIELLPVILFITAAIISFSIGSSWATAAMVFPIAIPLAVSMLKLDHIPQLDEVQILFPILGAVLSGCVVGDHISPIATTTVMSATSARARLMDHVKTQLPYALPMIFATAIAFLIITYLMKFFGLILATIISTFVGMIIAILLLKMLDKNK